MITYQMIREAQDTLVADWQEDGIKVIEAAAQVTPFGSNANQFLLSNCLACGGNLNGMLLSGIKKLYPGVWAAIPKIWALMRGHVSVAPSFSVE